MTYVFGIYLSVKDYKIYYMSLSMYATVAFELLHHYRNEQ